MTWYVYGNERVAKIKHPEELFEEEDDPEPGCPDPNIPGASETRCKWLYRGYSFAKRSEITTQSSTVNKFLATLDRLKPGVDSTAKLTNLNLPNTLHRVEVNAGFETMLLGSELQDSTYISILDTFPLTSGFDLFALPDTSGDTLTIPLYELVEVQLPEGYGGSGTSLDPYEAPYDDPVLTPVPPGDLSFYIHDHLGNTRVVYSTKVCDDAEGDTEYYFEHLFDYWPYGKVLREYHPVEEIEKYVTTHHERDPESGFDYRGARFYDSDIGRFLSVDPLAADFASVSPYVYTLNNPVFLVDPDGKAPIPPGVIVSKVRNENGKTTGVRVSGTVYIYGNQANPDLASSLQSEINNAWNGGPSSVTWTKNDQSYDVEFDISVVAVSIDEAKSLSEGNTDKSVNFLRVYEGDETVFGSSFKGNSGVLDLAQNRITGNTTSAHEIGHMMGFRNYSNPTGDETHFSMPMPDGTLPLMYAGQQSGNGSLRQTTQGDLNGLNLLKGLFGSKKSSKTQGEPNNNLIFETKQQIDDFYNQEN